MNAIVWIIIAITASTIFKLLNRHVAKDTSTYAYSLITQIAGTILFLPLAIEQIDTITTNAIPILIFASLLWTIVSLTTIASYKKTEVSLREPIGQSKIILTFILGTLLLSETITTQKIIGTLTIFLGITIALWHPERPWGKLTDKGVQWTLLSAVLASAVAITDKYALGYFTPEFYGLLVYLIPGIILTTFIKGKTQDIKHLIQTKGKATILAVIFSAITYYAIIKAYSLADITLVYPALQLSTLTTVIAGIIILKEKEHLWQRIIASIVVVVGVVVMWWS